MTKKAIRSFSFSALLILGGMVSFTMTSCAEVTSMLIEDSLQQGFQNNKNMKNSHPSAKAKEKEAERLKNEGKCPDCHGVGKTPDGRYTCITCNGTGKYQLEKK